MRRGVAFLLAATMVTACGGGGGEAELADAIGGAIWEEARPDIEQGTAPFDFSEPDADCIGGVFVDVIGYDTLVDAGVTVKAIEEQSETLDDLIDDEDLNMDDPATASALFDGIDGCIDLAEAVASVISEETGISEESASCFIEGLLAEDAFRESFVQGFVGGESADPFENPDPATVGIMFDLFNNCLTDEELAEFMGG